MGLKLYDRKPLAETGVGKTARKLALMRAGIDPRTEREKLDDANRLRQAKRWWDRNGGHFE